MLGSPSSQPALVSGAGAATVIEGERIGLAPPALLQYWQIVRRWKWVILGIVVAAMVVGLLATMLATREYTATARIEISREQKKITNVDGVESNSPGQDLEFYQTQHSLLRARSLAERVARALRLSNDDSFFAAQGVKPATDAGGAASFSTERQRREQMAVDLLLSHITISPVRGSALVDISYTSASPDVSARVANAWVQQFVVQSMDRRFASTSDARNFLEGRLNDLRTRLEKSERDLVNYASQKGIVAISRSKSADGRTEVDRTLVSSDLEALNAALIAATADRIAAESRADRRGEGQSAEALTNPAISTLRQKRAEVAAEYAKLMVRFEPGYPAARELAEQLKTLDASIAREEGRVAGSRQLSYAEALQREQQLRQRVEALKGGLNQQQQDSIQYNIYQREADTNRQLYDGLLQRYKEIGVAGVGASNIAVVDPAKVPTRPSSPNLLLNLALAFVIGLGLAAATTFALDQIDEGLRDPSRVNQLLQVPLLGSVPDLGNENALDQVRDTKSTLSEAYLSIRSSLAFSTDHGIPRSLMVTSTRAGEGKSTTSFALATILGRTGKNVLLLDADMRSPSMHVYVGTANVNGLSNILAGEDDWQKLVVPTGEKGLSLIPAGPMPPSAAELLSSDRMTMLIQQLVEHFDHIVIDSPPILGLADAPLLARTVEGSVFVIEADGVAIRGIRTSLARLQNVHAHILGVVITKLKRQHSGYGYGYGYGYSYGSDA